VEVQKFGLTRFTGRESLGQYARRAEERWEGVAREKSEDIERKNGCRSTGSNLKDVRGIIDHPTLNSVPSLRDNFFPGQRRTALRDGAWSDPIASSKNMLVDQLLKGSNSGTEFIFEMAPIFK
jgi:hypothetical protein